MEILACPGDELFLRYRGAAMLVCLGIFANQRRSCVGVKGIMPISDHNGLSPVSIMVIEVAPFDWPEFRD